MDENLLTPPPNEMDIHVVQQPLNTLSSKTLLPADINQSRDVRIPPGASVLEAMTESADVDYLIEHMQDYKNKGKIEIFHVFHCNYYFHVKEILKVLIKDLTLSVLVTDESGTFDEKEHDMLKESSSFASKGLVIGSGSSSESYYAKNESLQHYSNFLISESGKPDSFIFTMNYKQPQISDRKIGADIVNHALHLAPSKTFPFSWYLFGFKLYNFMVSHNINAASVSKHCMLIAEKLNMDRPTVEAALEHLKQNNVILYFRGALDDTVFSSVDIFARIFTEVFNQHYHNKDGRQSPIVVSGLELDMTLSRYAEEYISVSDFITLFTKLMILAPFNGSYIIPSFLTLLSEMKRTEACADSNIEPLFIKCPSTGYEFMSMLTVYLVTLPNNQWEILER